jgi:hypothetical protein
MSTADAIHDLYLARWGPPSREARFDARDYGISILKWAADATSEGVALYATAGASEWPLSGRDPNHRIELYTGLLPERDDIASAFAALGLYSVREGVALDHGHTVPNDGPLWPDTRMDVFLVTRPPEPLLPALDLSEGLHVEFLQVTPIYRSERAFKVEHGTEALIERWKRAGVPFWNPNRPDPLVD